jgi:subtilase family serine protease
LYGLTSQWSNGITGTGQTIGLYELETYAASDISTYQSCYGLSNPITVKNVDGGTTGSSGESTLDIEEAAALAPGASLVVYQGPNNYSGPLDTYTAIANQDTTSVISTSWGTCELDPTGDMAAEASIFQQMAAQGQTIIDAAGDSGSSDCEGVSGVTNQAQLAVDDPASQPYVTSVGGLQVTSISPLTQSIWNESKQSTNFGFSTSYAEGGGGGQSSYWPRPSWQTTTGATSSVTMRMVPDLSVMAQPSTGFITYYQGTWEQAGGTSIGAPIIAALVATAAQYCAVPRLGFLNPRLYQMGVAGTGFNDVTVGSNDIENQGSYSATTGFDMASGWGSPDPATFIPDLCAALPSSSHSLSSLSTKVQRQRGAATVSIVAQDALGLPIANQPVVVHVTGANGKLLSTGSALHTSINGSVRFAVTSSTPGVVSISAVIGRTSVFKGSVTFVASKRIASSRG